MPPALNAYSGQPERSALASAYDSYQVRFPDGTVVSRELPAGASDRDVRNAFLNVYKEHGYSAEAAKILQPKSNEDYWRAKLANQGEISAPQFNVGQPSENQGNVASALARQIAVSLGEHGFDVRQAYRRASDVLGFLNDFSPLGNLASALFPGSELEQQLSVLPLPGPERAAILKGIRAWHGSPHLFERFSLDKIGTGEGAQAYGHGLYFAEHPEVAKQYQRELAGMHGTRYETASGKIIEPRHPDVSIALDDIASTGDLGDWFQWKPEDFSGPQGPALQELMSLRDVVAEGGLRKVSKPNPGHLYEVNINADPDSLLDWDRPLSEQGEPAQKFLGAELSRYLGPSYERQISNFRPLPAGELLSHTFGRGLGGQRMTEQALDSGVPGIKYLDQGSRTAGDGTRNFVVFDENLVDIVSRDGVPLRSTYGMTPSMKYPMAARDEWYGEADYLMRGGSIVDMTPDDFLSRARPMVIDDISRENIDDLKAHIQSGRTLDPLLLRPNGIEDGRHRAHAAKELGIQTVPVIIYK